MQQYLYKKEVEEARQRIAEQTEEFLANGGEIQQCTFEDNAAFKKLRMVSDRQGRPIYVDKEVRHTFRKQGIKKGDNQ